MLPKRTKKQLIGEVLSAINLALSDVGVVATYGWPEEWTSLPIVTYSLGGITDKDRDVNKLVVGYLLTYNIDIWCKSPSKCLDLFEAVEEALNGLGYTCVTQGTIYEDKTRHHLRATATGYYDVIQNQVR